MRRLLLPSLVTTIVLVALYGVLRKTARDSNEQPGAPREEKTEFSKEEGLAQTDLSGSANRSVARRSPASTASTPAPRANESSRGSISTSENMRSPAGEYAAPGRWRKTAMPCWGLRGTAPEDYDVEVDSSVFTAGNSSASLASIRATSGWGALYQFASARDLRGQRIEFSADVRTIDVQRAANLFVRADDANGNAVALDDMWFSYAEDRRDGHLINRNIIGDSDWNTYRIVVDIPVDAAVISYGVALDGPGKLWIDNALLERTGPETPTTAISRPAHMLQSAGTFTPVNLLPTPKNLAFDRGPSGSGCE
jgi:hypothetical protein